MKTHLLDYRYTYRAEYVRWGGRKTRPVYLTGTQPVEIVEVDPAEAPVAYRISSGEPNYHEGNEVRSFNGSLWWPVSDYGNPLAKSAFLSLVTTDWERASRVLDPMHRTYYLDAETFDEFLARTKVSDGKFASDRELQAKQAEWDASRIIICGDQVLVDAGDPVWYAVLDEAAARVDLVVGHSDLDRSHVDRPHGAGFFTPGPDRNVRIACGRLSLVFGLEEISSALSTFTELGHEFRFVSEIVALSGHAPAPAAAAELCVRASAQHLREIAWLKPDLRKAMPELADTSRADDRTDLRSDRSLLQKFVGLDVPALRRDHARWIAEARKVLDRLATHEPLAEEDEAALGRLAI
jgi:hypothetical protein